MSVDARASLTPPDRLRPTPTRLDNAANRRMCAGACRDHAFRDRLLREIYNAPDRRVAPSYGFDVVLVLEHAWRAWWLEFVEQVVLLAVVIVALIVCPACTIIAVSALAIWHLLRALPAWAEKLTHYYSGRHIPITIVQVRARGRVLGYGLLIAAVTFLGAMVAAFNASDQSAELGESWFERTGLIGALIILAVLALIVATATVVQLALSGQLRRREPQRSQKPGRRMRVIDEQQYHPVTVHSGFRPFIGSGIRVQSWSFAQRLVQRKVLETEPDQEYDQPPFRAQELIDRLKKMISGLRTEEHPETSLPGLDVADQIFVEGTHAWSYRHVLRSLPASDDVEEAMTEAIAKPSDVARHYLACQVVSWGGEIVTTVFVHVSLQGRTLYLEFSTYALLPTRTEYHVVDMQAETGASAVVKEVTRKMRQLPEELLATRRLATAPVQLWAAVRPGKDQTIRKVARIDIGAAVSAREVAAIEADQSYFQYQDILQHSKVIERRLIATVGDYLTELGVDTSEFWERATAILNNGVINASSGTVNIAGSAVGTHATVATPSPPPGGAGGSPPSGSGG
jgi:hypothetical protein